MNESVPEWGERLVRIILERASHADPQVTLDTLARLVERLEQESNSIRLDAPLAPENNVERYRWDHEMIVEHIPAGSSVLDLGCGAGTLLARLIREKGVRAQGIELVPEQVLECVANGVPVFQTNLDEGLAGFPDRSFDYVVLEETLQTLHRPVLVLNEMLRVGRLGIVTFPNFAHWRVRLDLSVNGRMPVTRAWPYSWYESPNIRPLTLHDFETWVEEEGIEIVDGHVWSEGRVREFDTTENLFAEEAMLVIRRAA